MLCILSALLCSAKQNKRIEFRNLFLTKTSFAMVLVRNALIAKNFITKRVFARPISSAPGGNPTDVSIRPNVFVFGKCK